MRVVEFAKSGVDSRVVWLKIIVVVENGFLEVKEVVVFVDSDSVDVKPTLLVCKGVVIVVVVGGGRTTFVLLAIDRVSGYKSGCLLFARQVIDVI